MKVSVQTHLEKKCISNILGQKNGATCIIIKENARSSGTLILREVDPEVGTLENLDGDNMLPRE